MHVFTSFPNRFSCEFHITQDDGDSEDDDDYSDEEFDEEEDANDTLMSVHLDTFLEKRYQFILVPLLSFFIFTFFFHHPFEV